MEFFPAPRNNLMTNQALYQNGFYSARASPAKRTGLQMQITGGGQASRRI